MGLSGPLEPEQSSWQNLADAAGSPCVTRVNEEKFSLERHDLIEHLSLLCETKHSMESVNALQHSKTNGSKSSTAVFTTMRLGTQETYVVRAYSFVPSFLTKVAAPTMDYNRRWIVA